MGVAARQQLNTNVKNTVINFKHLVGRKYSDPMVQKMRPFIPVEMVELPNNDVGFKVGVCHFRLVNRLSSSCLFDGSK